MKIRNAGHQALQLDGHPVQPGEIVEYPENTELPGGFVAVGSAEPISTGPTGKTQPGRDRVHPAHAGWWGPHPSAMPTEQPAPVAPVGAATGVPGVVPAATRASERPAPVGPAPTREKR